MSQATIPPKEITEELIEAFLRLSRADFTVRLPRNHKRDTADLLAMFVNQIAEELGRLLDERDASRAALEHGVSQLSEAFVQLASGNFTARVPRSERGDPLDVLAFLFNNMAAELGDAAAELHKQREVLEATIESMVDGVLLLDYRSVVQRPNSAFCRMLGLDRSAVVGARLGSLLVASEQMVATRLADEAMHGAVRGRTLVFRTASGDPLSLTVNASPQRVGDDGEAVGLVLVARDDRDLKKAQAQLQLSDRLATMGSLAAGVAHEINNPLAFIAGNIDFVMEETEALADALPEEPRLEIDKALKAARDGAERVRQIVKDLKAFSRVDEEEVAQVSLARILDAAVHMVRHEIRHRAVLEKNYGEVPLVDANEARLLQVFLNLIQNAAQAIPAGRADDNRIRLMTGTLPDGRAFAAVQDTGSGIAPKDLPRIFDAFFTTKAVGSGTGLGLSISHKIVTGFGGTIEVESEVGGGTTFRVLLPPGGGGASSADARVPRPSSPPARRKRVLIVDDEVEVGHTLLRILGREHEVVAVARGREALPLLAEREWDIVLCDLMMPEMTGVEVYTRAIEQRPELARRFVFLTGGSFDENVRAFLLRVPNGLVEKPFDARDLRTLVARA
ncbi:Sensory box histidine kinase/response regulator [Labilithrix luteola]|uniref:histidine kinase n=1 Tax=Labilithrix luteola TaxID=1391654 RepID=A0A0K1Q5A2_9BACT|nr:ATP-binding protein [Labilithrix luteola]AKV00585.1 Sensory box histidine kinase/response regulator [Labilithrix luteola]